MRRLDLRTRRAPCAMAAVLLAMALHVPATASTSAWADDRPPLIAAEPAPDGSAVAGRLVDFTVVSGADDVQLLLRGDGAVPYEMFRLAEPDRLVLDLPGVVADTGRKRAEIGAGGVQRVRVGQYRSAPDPVARVVLELDRPLAWTVSREGDLLRVRMAGPAASGMAAAASAVETLPVEPAVEAAAAPVEPVEQIAEAAPAVARPEPTAASDVTATPAPPASEAAWQAEQAAYTPPAGPGQRSLYTPPRAQPEAASYTVPAAAAAPASASPEPATAAPAVSAPAVAGPAPVTRSAPQPAAERPARELEPAGTMFAPAQAEAVPAAAATTAAAPATTVTGMTLPDFETKTIQDQRRTYTGKAISLNLVDADIRQVFSVFHDLSGLNFVLDPAVSGAVTIVVDEVPWDQALDLILQNNGLEMALEGNVIRIAPVVKLAQEAAARRALREAKELEANPVTITRTLSYAKAKDVERVIREAIVSSKGRVIIDERTNTLIIRDIPDRVDAIDKLLTTLDAETPQVMIEARIVEVSRDYSYDLGIRWGATAAADTEHGTQTNLDFPHNASGEWSLNLPRNPAAHSFSLSFGNVLDSLTLDVTLDALETEGHAKRLSSPKIATQNNEPAEIEQGVRFPIVNTTATEIRTEFVSASLRMRCTPQITAEGTVILDVEVANDSPDFVDRSSDTVPAVNTQRATTKVLIADGGTTVIGGIYTVNEGQSTRGVPWFSKLPGLGWLFRSKSITNKNRELLIFITPRIIKAA